MTKTAREKKPFFTLFVFGCAVLLSVMVLYPFVSQFLAKPAAQLSYAELPTASGEKPDSIIFLLHGSGGSGAQMIDELGPMIRNTFPDTLIVAPNAPLVITGKHYDRVLVWHEPFYGLMTDGLLKPVKNASLLLGGLIEEKKEEHSHIDTNRIFFLGFSQGATVALYAAPRIDPPIGGVAAYAGRLLKDDVGATLHHRIPVFLFYNKADPLVDFKNYQKTLTYFESLKFPVVSRTESFEAHSITLSGVRAGLAFIEDNM